MPLLFAYSLSTFLRLATYVAGTQYGSLQKHSGMEIFSLIGTGSPSSSGGASTSGGSMPHYDPNNVINTGAKYDPNAANSGMGAASGGSAPSFANGMGLNAHQQVPPGAANWAGSTPPPSGSGSPSSGSSSSGSSAG